MKKICTLLILSLSFLAARSQFFTAPGGPIIDNGTDTSFYPVTVTGVGIINSTVGLTSICLNIVHTWDSDLTIGLRSPDGTNVILSSNNGGSGDNYSNTCFDPASTSNITTGVAPFPGNYLPQQNAANFNYGQNADGIWYLWVFDNFNGQTGSVTDFTIGFDTSPFMPIPGAPQCTGASVPAGDACGTALPICNAAAYCGTTSSSYNNDTWPELTATFCGSLENNSFLSFVASGDSAVFYVWVTSSLFDLGVQVFCFDGGCGSGAITAHGCAEEILQGTDTTEFHATGLIPGNTYYIMMDGFAGDVCDYILQPVSGIALSSAIVNYLPNAACVSSFTPVTAVVSGATGGTFSANPNGLNIDPTTGAIFPNLSTVGIYDVAYTVTGPCGPGITHSTITITDPAQFVWTGAVSTAWEDPGNWTCGNIPNATTDVVLTQGTIVISSNVTIHSLIMSAAVHLTVTPGYNFTILN